MFQNLNQDYSNMRRGTSGEHLIFILQSPDFNKTGQDAPFIDAGGGMAIHYLEFWREGKTFVRSPIFLS
jgi:hypothetical protein